MIFLGASTAAGARIAREALWRKLVLRVKLLTTNHGSRARLAAQLFVSPKELHLWLKGRVPGAPVALALLEWAEAEEIRLAQEHYDRQRQKRADFFKRRRAARRAARKAELKLARERWSKLSPTQRAEEIAAFEAGVAAYASTC